MNWIPSSTILRGRTVELIPLENSHFHELSSLAKDPRIWQHYVYDGTQEEKFSGTLKSALMERDLGNQFPFAIFSKTHDKLAGGTRLMDIQQKHRKLEIGTTWLHPDYWGTGINLECKLLLLTFSFEILGTLRVQLKTDENNIRSRKAIEKIGGKFEGIIRNDMVRDNLTSRNSALYSIIHSEWPAIKQSLNNVLNAKLKVQ
jgi:RimJ/RimL family protein N-acetyltransferase